VPHVVRDWRLDCVTLTTLPPSFIEEWTRRLNAPITEEQEENFKKLKGHIETLKASYSNEVTVDEAAALLDDMDEVACETKKKRSHRATSDKEIKPLEVFVTLTLLKNNLSYDVLAVTMLPYLGRVFHESTVREMTNYVLMRNARAGSFARTMRRFQVKEKYFFMCTFMSDGVPMFCRGNEKLFNGKHDDKYLLFQVALMMDGCPLAWFGPHYGREHDCTCMQGSDMFPHKEKELGLGDLAFSSLKHYLTQVKGTKKKNKLSEGEDLFDIEFRRVRNRVEHFFAQLDEFRCMWYNLHGIQWNTYAFSMIFNSECLVWELNDKREHTDTIVYTLSCSDYAMRFDEQPDCNCKFRYATKMEKEKTVELRDEITERLVRDDVEPMSKPPAHSAKSRNKPYYSKTRAQLQEKKKERRAKREAELKAERSQRGILKRSIEKASREQGENKTKKTKK